jgi:PadR family transcriptional regulator, regulatory protein PadR
MPERITRSLRKLLEAFMEDPSQELYGLDIIDKTRLKSGTLYPMLHRLVQEGWLERRGPIPSDTGGAPRYNYKLTGQGATSAARILEADRAPARTPTLRPGVAPA